MMDFSEHYFYEKKKSRSKRKKKKKSGGYNHSSYFNSKKYDRKVSGTLDLNLVGETLDTKVDASFYTIQDNIQAAEFFVDDVRYNIYFNNEWAPNVFEVFFGNDRSGFDMSGDVDNPLKVFGAVSDVLQQWIKKENPKSFFFSAKEPSRIRLYNRFSKMIQNKLPYKFDEELNDEIANLIEEPLKFYTFTRI